MINLLSRRPIRTRSRLPFLASGAVALGAVCIAPCVAASASPLRVVPKDPRILLAQAEGSVVVPNIPSQSPTTATAPTNPTSELPQIAPEGAPENGAPSGGPPSGGPPPVPVLLGIADFLIAVDRPFDAEDIYHGILGHDAENEGALAGLKRAKLYERPTLTLLTHNYSDSHDVRLNARGGGPTFRTRYGNLTFTAGTGYYRNNNDPSNPKNPLGPIASFLDDDKLDKNTFNLLLEPHYKKYEGSFFVSRVTFDWAPDRTLYDFRASYLPQPSREKYTLSVARRDSILQSAQAQFLPPETYYTVTSGLTLNEYAGAVEYPLTPKLDLSANYLHYNYSDGNSRDTAKAALYYRLQPTAPQQMPVARIGLGYLYDDTDKFNPLYYSPQSTQSLSVLADYVMIKRGFKFGIFAGYPLLKDQGTGFAKHDPARTLFGFVNKEISDRFELYAKGGFIRSPGYDLSFNDIVLGVNVRL